MLNTTLTLVHHQFDLMVQLLDSHASRMSPNQALLTLRADHNGGQHANYRKWYFAAQLDLDGAISSTLNLALQRSRSQTRSLRSRKAADAKVSYTGAEPVAASDEHRGEDD